MSELFSEYIKDLEIEYMPIDFREGKGLDTITPEQYKIIWENLREAEAQKWLKVSLIFIFLSILSFIVSWWV